TGHIETAIFWNWSTELYDQIQRDILTPEHIADLLGKSGITPASIIVLYGDNNHWFAAFAYWQFKMYVQRNDCIMDGGRVKWAQENRSYTTKIAKIEQGVYPVKAAEKSARAMAPGVLKPLEREETALVDVRSPEEYTGEIIAPEGMMEPAQ